MKNKSKSRKLVPKDHKNINKYISSPQIKEIINEAILLSKDCKENVSSIISEKFVDFMTPIEIIMRDLFNDLSNEIMIRYDEVYKSKNSDKFYNNISLISDSEIHRLYDEIENKILKDGKIILDNSDTLDSVSNIYKLYLKNLEKIVLKASKFKILPVINHLEFIQIDTKNFINNIVHSVFIESFELYKDEMDRYFLDIQSFIDNNNRIILESIKDESSSSNKLNNFDITNMAKIFDDLIKSTQDDILATKNRIFTHYKYKELNNIAINNGFILNRVSGGHGIFINDSGKIVVIPQGRDIGKGLQIKILKRIGVRN